VALEVTLAGLEDDYVEKHLAEVKAAIATGTCRAIGALICTTTSLTRDNSRARVRQLGSSHVWIAVVEVSVTSASEAQDVKDAVVDMLASDDLLTELETAFTDAGVEEAYADGFSASAVLEEDVRSDGEGSQSSSIYSTNLMVLVLCVAVLIIGFAAAIVYAMHIKLSLSSVSQEPQADDTGITTVEIQAL